MSKFQTRGTGTDKSWSGTLFLCSSPSEQELRSHVSKGIKKITKDIIVITEFLFKLKLQLKLTCLKDCENTKREEKHWLHVDFAYHNWTRSTYWFTDKEVPTKQAWSYPSMCHWEPLFRNQNRLDQKFQFLDRGTSIQKRLKFANIHNESHGDKKWISVFSNKRTRTNCFLAKQLQE